MRPLLPIKILFYCLFFLTTSNCYKINKRFFENDADARKNFHENFCDGYYAKQMISFRAYLDLCKTDEALYHKATYGRPLLKIDESGV